MSEQNNQPDDQPDDRPDDRSDGRESPDEPLAQDDPATALARAEATAADNWNRYLRAVADLDNLRKRAARDVEQARRTGADRLAGDLLPVIDGLEMGLEATTAAPATVESLVAGQEAILRLLRAALERTGIETIDPLGEPFDPQVHEAMSMQSSPTAEPGSVLLVMQKGYRIGDRLLRPARVIVAGEPPGSAPVTDA